MTYFLQAAPGALNTARSALTTTKRSHGALNAALGVSERTLAPGARHAALVALINPAPGARGPSNATCSAHFQRRTLIGERFHCK
eukprot:5775-Pleurochrysis_carterae.AAC.4